MSEFDEWFPRHSLTGSGVQLYSKSDLETVWQACQATSAARIAELEAEVKALDSSFDSCNAENDSFRMINSNMALRIAELEAEIAQQSSRCGKLLAEIDYEYNKKSNDSIMRHAQQIEMLQADCKVMADSVSELHRMPYGLSTKPEAIGKCACPACTIAAKYREGK